MNESRGTTYLLEDVMRNKFDYGFYAEELWAYVKEKDIREYDMKDVRHWVYAPCWSYTIDEKQEEECFISIYQVLLQREKFPEHIARIDNADIQYPLIVIEDEYDQYGTILDGNHRFAKMLMLEEPSTKVKIHYITRTELLLNNIYHEI